MADSTLTDELLDQLYQSTQPTSPDVVQRLVAEVWALRVENRDARVGVSQIRRDWEQRFNRMRNAALQAMELTGWPLTGPHWKRLEEEIRASLPPLDGDPPAPPKSSFAPSNEAPPR